MYNLLLILHSVVRWVVVIAAILAVGAALRGWLGRREWSRLDDRLGLLFTIALDIQVLLGIILYIVSPLIQDVLANFGAAMEEPQLRYFAVTHAVLMIGAAVLVHVGRALVKRQEDSAARHKRAAIFYGLATVVMLVAIPWPFIASYARPWIRLS